MEKRNGQTALFQSVRARQTHPYERTTPAGRIGTMPSPSAPSPAELLLQCHLGYEIWMLQETYRRCPNDANNTARADDAVIRDNALIESFCVHARNLIEFFTKETSRKKLQKQYTNNYWPVSAVSITKINKHLNNQITHLREGERPITDSEKIGPQERAKILTIL